MKFTSKQLAQKANVSEPAITKAVSKGQLIRGKDKKIDSSIPRNRQWLIAHNVRFESVTIPENDGLKNVYGGFVGDDGEKRTFEELTGLPEALSKMTLEELCFHHGDIKNISVFIDNLNKLLASVHRSVKIDADRKELIPRDFTTSHLFRYIDLMNLKIIENIEVSTQDEIAIIKSKGDCEKEIIDNRKAALQKIISDSKKEIISSIKKLKIKTEDEAE